MAKITVAMECGCFKRSGYDVEQIFANHDEALVKAEEMVENMNETFCGIHKFTLQDSGEDITIAGAMAQENGYCSVDSK